MILIKCPGGPDNFFAKQHRYEPPRQKTFLAIPDRSVPKSILQAIGLNLASKTVFPQAFGPTTEIDAYKMPRGSRQFLGQATSLRATPVENILIFPGNSRPFQYRNRFCRRKSAKRQYHFRSNVFAVF